MFGSVGFIARTQLRRRWRSLVVLAVFVGLLGGVAIALVAGSRRSSSVVDRYFAAGLRYDLKVYAPSLTADDLLAIPGVDRADLSAYLGSVFLEPDGTSGAAINSVAIEQSSADPTIQVLDGHLDRTDPFNALVNEAFVEEFGVGAGETVTMQMFGLEQMDDVIAGRYDVPEGPRYTFDVSAVVRTPPDITVDEVETPEGSTGSRDNLMLVPARFYREHRDEFLDFGASFDVQLADPTGDEAFMAAVEDRLAGEDPPFFGPARFTERRDTLNTPVDVETAALLALGLGLALAGVVATGVLLRTEQRSHDDDAPTLRALGMSVLQLRAAAALRALLVGLIAILLAVVVAVALSGRFPVGIGRQLELADGLEVNVAVVAVGALVLLGAVVALGFSFGRPPRRRGGVRSSRWTLSAWLTGIGAHADLVLGTHFAFERRREGSFGPSRQALLGGAAALAVVAALGTVVGGVDRLHDDAGEHGFPWDVAIGNINFDLSAEVVADLTGDPRVETSTLARYGQARVDGEPIEVLVIDEAGTAPPHIVSGRLPASPSEIALGARLLRELDREVGDTVEFSVTNMDLDLGEATHDLEMTVVGVALPPVLGEFDLGELGIITFDGVAAAGGSSEAQLVLARLRGDDPEAAAADLDRDVTREILTDVVPARISSLYRVRSLPLLGMLLAGAMGTVILVYVLAMGVRARLRDLALLRALGLPSRRLTRILVWQGIAVATAMALLGLAFGVPLGSVLWRALTHQLGVDDEVVLRPLIFVLVPASFCVAIATSWASARRVRRAQVASLLRASLPRVE